MSKKDEFIKIYTEHIKREGSVEFLDFLCSSKSDFFIAPAALVFTETMRAAW